MPAIAANLALELAPVRVNVVAAGFVDTRLSARELVDALEHRREELRATLPVRRVIEPSDVAAMVLTLMNSAARPAKQTSTPLRLMAFWVTGDTLIALRARCPPILWESRRLAHRAVGLLA
jgi:NAD(P)-dependent dehydrogenase (short-subunit alcohol dehydrogenase family)